MKKIILVLSVALLSFYSCHRLASTNLQDPLDAHCDSTLNPGDNFWLFANNAWFTANPIPSSEKSNGIFRTIQDTINSQILQICQRAGAENNPTGSLKQKIGDFYFSGMDTIGIEKNGLQAIQSELNSIQNVKTKEELQTLFAHLHQLGIGVGFYYGVGRDDKIASKYAVWLVQGGIGLPDRDYYFMTDAKSENIRKEYKLFIAKLLSLSGAANANAMAEQIFSLEKDLASGSRKLEDLRDPYANYNKMSIDQANQLSAGFNWRQFSNSIGLANLDTMIVGQPEFVRNFNTTYNKYPLNVWQAYCQFHLLNDLADYLPKSFEQANFHFFGEVFSGIKEQKPRWKRVVETTDGMLGELIGQVYVKEYLPAGAKEKITEIGKAVAAVYADHIKALDWMSDSTKTKALYKLNHITMKMGYPDKWKDMSSVNVVRNSYVSNVLACKRWEVNYNLQKFGKPVDRTEWNMTPQTYNAYYDPTNNEIVIPACNIIVPGFEGRMPDDAVLYGIIGGSTIGHEITHGFDDQGSQYDAEGNLRNWWSAEDKAKFDVKTKMIVAQFNNYKVLDSIAINGEATQGENIADLGGVVMGYEAFKKTAQGRSNEKIGGFTPDQRYFLSYAYSWMVHMRPESLARNIKTDVHSPAEFRVNGPVSNNENFYKAFNILPGQAMYRPDAMRVKIW